MSEAQWHRVVAGLVVVLAACASAEDVSDLGFGQPAAAAENTINVQNDYWGEMDVYAVSGGMRVRLGSVPAGRAGKLRIPWQLALRPDIRLQIDPVGPESAFTFPPVTLHPGATVELSVANTLRMSSFSVW